MSNTNIPKEAVRTEVWLRITSLEKLKATGGPEWNDFLEGKLEAFKKVYGMFDGRVAVPIVAFDPSYMAGGKRAGSPSI
jgi:hypothetical protein